MATTSSPTDDSSRFSAKWCHDQDIFRIEPMAFDLCDTVLISGTDGAIASSYTLSSAGSDFTDADTEVAAGDVVQITIASVGNVLARVDAVASATALTIARLGSIGAKGDPFADGSSLPFTIKTMDSWIRNIQYDIGVNKLGMDDPNKAITDTETGDDYTNIWRPESLRLALAHQVLAEFFESQNSGGEDALFTRKTTFHQARADRYLATARILTKKDAEDDPSSMITPGYSTMVRV